MRSRVYAVRFTCVRPAAGSPRPTLRPVRDAVLRSLSAGRGAHTPEPHPGLYCSPAPVIDRHGTRTYDSHAWEQDGGQDRGCERDVEVVVADGEQLDERGEH